MSGLSLHPRSDWEEKKYPVNGPAAEPSKFIDIVLHYPGSDFDDMDFDNDGDVDRDDTKTIIRRWQRAWVSGRGYSLGYNFVLGRSGDLWEVRGLEFRNAANGPTTIPGFTSYNDVSVSLKFVTDLDGALSPEQRSTAAAAVGIIRMAVGRLLGVKGHGDVKPTACPGPELRKMIAQGAFDVVAPPLPPPPASFGVYLVRPGDSPWAVARRVYGSGSRHPEITAVSPTPWHPGDRIKVPGFDGTMLNVEQGDSPWSLIRESGQQPTASKVDRFRVWNGGDRVLRPGETVFVER